jgi:hypothetical protein
VSRKWTYLTAAYKENHCHMILDEGVYREWRSGNQPSCSGISYVW